MTIYCIKNTINDKCYIGQTRQKFKYRKNVHIKQLNERNHRNPHLENSWNKYGEDVFEFKILEEGFNSINELNEAEVFWIQYLRTLNPESGYNLDKGGGVKLKRNEETLRKIGDAHSYKTAQYDLNGILINTYKSIIEASKKTNISRTNIGTCISGKTLTAGNYQWKKYENEPKKKIFSVLSPYERTAKKISKPVAVYNLKGELLKTFENRRKGAKYLGVEFTSLKEATIKSSDTKTCGGHQVRLYEDEPKQKIPEVKPYRERIGIKNRLKVAIYNKKGKLVRTFKDTKSVREFLNVSKSAIDMTVSGHHKTCKGYQIKRFEKEPIRNIAKVKPHAGGKNVKQINKDGEVVNTFKSMKEASRITGIGYHTIYDLVHDNLTFPEKHEFSWLKIK